MASRTSKPRSSTALLAMTLSSSHSRLAFTATTSASWPL
uniref:Uncharacterized protein n=1 Tax=Arundo donax TaxID=35708 RepID=A0A0A9BLD1_ARUDO